VNLHESLAALREQGIKSWNLLSHPVGLMRRMTPNGTTEYSAVIPATGKSTLHAVDTTSYVESPGGSLQDALDWIREQGYGDLLTRSNWQYLSMDALEAHRTQTGQ
jgi:hypothetical protein